MREPRPEEVVDAVAYVTGVDPAAVSRRPRIIAARRLACQALSEICELSQPEIGAALDLERSTVSHHLHAPCDFDALGMVIQRLSDVLDTSGDRERLLGTVAPSPRLA